MGTVYCRDSNQFVCRNLLGGDRGSEGYLMQDDPMVQDACYETLVASSECMRFLQILVQRRQPSSPVM